MPPLPSPQQDEQMIQAAFEHLLSTYLATNHRKKTDIITKAFNFAKQAHKGVRRRSGEPYILHPIAVAQIVCEEIGLGSTSICAALLHDVEEDTDYTNEDICNLFGQKVANIVEGLTKVAGGIFGEQASLQAETFKKLLLTMSDDVRVILIKIADRLHNMRTLQSMLPSKQQKISSETFYIFAPIADRLGLNKIKTELENLSFRYEHPEEADRIARQLQQSQPDRDAFVESFLPPIRQRLDRMGLRYTVSSRVKSVYSIWSKMQHKHVPFEEVYDILAIRIVFTPERREEEKDDCFRIYGALTDIYKVHPTRFRDWVSSPKANGYQALHNTFMSHEGKWVEVQIRSDRMDDIAEHGFAAHWKYKEAGAHYDENELDRWLNSIKEILDDPQPDTLDLLDTIKLNLFTSEILVFTPKGELKTMPAGSTALDFAFSIHSFLGSHCIGAKVNHKLVPLNYKLKSGDQVSILTARTQHVKDEWLNYTTTAKARGKIRAILRRDARERGRSGEALLREFLTQNEVEPTTAIFEKLSAAHGFPSRELYFQALGEQKLVPTPDDVALLHGKRRGRRGLWRKFIPFMGSHRADEATQSAAAKTSLPADFVRELDRKKVLVLDERTVQQCEVATCCHPIPGDDVMGFITPRGTLCLHKRSCETATKLKARYGNNIIACRWDMHKQLAFDTTIFLRGVDSQGVLYGIADVLHKQTQFAVKRVTLTTDNGIFEGQIDIAVYDTDDIDTVCRSLMEIENVTKAVRIETNTV